MRYFLKYAGCLVVLLILQITIVQAQQTAGRNCTIQWVHTIGNSPLQPDSIYTNAAGETFTISGFKYYISNMVLKGDGEQQYPNNYFLINEADSNSKQFQLATTLNNIQSIQFMVGVDSIKNVSGVQTGALDPAKGMFWTWNSGYIMAKLEGNAPIAKTPQHAFSYHVGGYKPQQQTVRTVVLNLPQPMVIKNNSTITIQVNILQWFNALQPLQIAQHPICHEPGPLAVQMADNYQHMFSIIPNP